MTMMMTSTLTTRRNRCSLNCVTLEEGPEIRKKYKRHTYQRWNVCWWRKRSGLIDNNNHGRSKGMERNGTTLVVFGRTRTLELDGGCIHIISFLFIIIHISNWEFDFSLWSLLLHHHGCFACSNPDEHLDTRPPPIRTQPSSRVGRHLHY